MSALACPAPPPECHDSSTSPGARATCPFRAGRNRWFTEDGYGPEQGPWAAAWFLAGAAYLASRMATPAPGPALEAAIGLLFDRFCLWTVIAGATLFWQRVNASGPAWSSLAASSYGIYYVRPLILYPLAYLLGGVALPIAIKAPALIVTTVLAAWGFTALVLRRLPGLRRIF